jgi:methylenetetrahydrofolate dehydrogenase (NADP+) / methenyltetrahydrofolate cyclohydrolase
VAAILFQMPLHRRIPLTVVIDTLDPAKDIDGLHPRNAGLLSLGYDGFLPTTAHAAVEILKRSSIPLSGRRVTLVGRSNVVGKPAALLMLRENATVTVCHSRTADLGHHTRDAEIVIVAAGVPGLITGDMLSPGAVVVDVGINVVNDRLVGDVDFESASRVASAITPVPGGVGPVTNALLLTHLVRAAQAQASNGHGHGALHLAGSRQ